MSKNVINFSHENTPPERINVGIDFSKTKVINDPTIENKFEEESRAELVSFQRVDTAVRPIKSKIQLGSYLTKDQLQKILKKDTADKTVYRMMEHVRKNDLFEMELNKDFDLLRDFFPNALVLEVQDYCRRIIQSVESKIEEETEKKMTPRKRRAYILAVFRSVCRKNGRKLTEELMEEVNNRFGYNRRMKLYEVYQAENELIQWNYLSKKIENPHDYLKTFFLTAVNQINRLKEHTFICESPEQQEIIALTQKFIMSYASKKETRDALTEVVRHKDNDYAARLTIWCIAKYFAQEKFDISFKTPEELPGWRELFLLENGCSGEEEEIPIRSFKYVFWSSFALRKELKENGLYPEEDEDEAEEKEKSAKIELQNN